jgi:hypothetical protein
LAGNGLLSSPRHRSGVKAPAQIAADSTNVRIGVARNNGDTPWI